MKRKTLFRAEWPRIVRESFAWQRVEEPDFRGEAALMRLGEGQKPFYVENGGEVFCIADAGYAWLQLAYADRNCWATVMFDRKGKIVQWYYDVTGGNVLLSGGDTWFEDRYLDVVLLPDGRRFLLDEEELQAARRRGEIGKADCETAQKTARLLMESLTVSAEEALCQRLYRRLLPILA